MNSDLAGDLAFLALTTHLGIQGATPPARADATTSKPARRDYLASLRITTSLASLYRAQLALLALAAAVRLVFPAAVDVATTTLSVTSSSSSPPSSSHPPGRGGDWARVRAWWRLACVTSSLGSSLRLWCYRCLGRYFTFDLHTTKGQKVIQSGPYAWVRHPAYTGMLLHSISTLLTHYYLNPALPARWRSVDALGGGAARLALPLASLAAVAGVALRIRQEERMLLDDDEVGKEYRAYMQKVPSRLLPGVI